MKFAKPILACLIAGSITGLIFAVAYPLLFAALCSSGSTPSVSTCSPIFIWPVILMSLAFATVLTYLPLKKIVKNSSGYICISGTLLGLSLLPLLRVLETRYGLVVWAVTFGVTYVIAWLVYRLRFKKLVMIATLVAALAIYHFAVPQSVKLDQALFNNTEAKAVDELPFSVYLPSQIPQGTQFEGGMLYHQEDSAIKNKHYEADYYGSESFKVNSFAIPSDFNPPTSCGWESPGHSIQVTVPCDELGSTTAGDKVFIARVKNMDRVTAYVRRDSTLVTISCTYRQAMTDAEYMQVADSLTKRTGSELTALSDANNK